MIAIPRLSAPDADGARAAARCVVETHHRLAAWLRVGLTLAEIDDRVARILEELGCRSCFLGYKPSGHRPFPSHACLSVNDCIVHGTHWYYQEPMRPGDVLSIDIGVTHKGWIGDAAWTYALGEMTDDAKRLMACGRESLRRGVRELRPGARLVEWASTVQSYVEGECGLFLTRGLGGHGYGRKLHSPPYVSNVAPTAMDPWPDGHLTWPVGALVAVEPMIALGTGEKREVKREWPIFTADGSLAVHYEHDVLITEAGPEVLTAGLEELPDVVG